MPKRILLPPKYFVNNGTKPGHIASNIGLTQKAHEKAQPTNNTHKTVDNIF
jgi:hypothetical protein